ncbi:sialoadhesin-like [Hoplias malabaricus]|uniref:sialoadhesin-like n=1 Tax=Hoplias malabaricus TaxID=27720 RepID=UPI00346299F7
MSFGTSLPCVVCFMVLGASGAEWSVKYNQQEICALKGSTVFMNSSYTHPDGLTVNKTFWIIDPVQGVMKPDLRKESNYSGRVEYFTDEQKKHFSLKLSNVEKKDEHYYCFRIITNDDKERWLGTPGVLLTVTELRVETPGAVTEGGAAVLKCVTTCSLTDPTFIWYKNGRHLTTKTTTNNQLHLQPVSSEDAGSYSCAVNGYQHLPSPDHTLKVRYPPKNVSVSISSSGAIVEDSSVTLTCSSDGHPPVENYTWFKGSVSIGTGESFRILNINSEDSGEYTCQSQNQLGQRRSPAVDLNVQYSPKNITVSISSSGEIVEDSSVTLTCSSDANPPVEIYTWFIEGGVSPVGSGHSYRPLQSGFYYCEARNEHGAQRSAAVPAKIKGFLNAVLYGVAGAGCGVLIIIIIAVILIWKCRGKASKASKNEDQSEAVVYTVIEERSRCSDTTLHSQDLQKDVYANVLHWKTKDPKKDEGSVAKASNSALDEDQEDKSQEDDVQYASIKFHHSPAAKRLSGITMLRYKELSEAFRKKAIDEYEPEPSLINSHCLDVCEQCWQRMGFSGMMSLKLTPPFPLIFLLMIVGASGAEWSVKYNQQKICALKGSTVFMNGSYTHPDGLRVTEAFWIIYPVQGVEKPDLSKESDYSGRVEYFTDEQKKHFSLKLSNVEKKDEHQYYFRIITNNNKERWLGEPGVLLSVTELRVQTPGAVTEGGAAVLKCVTTCSLTDPTFIWYKNGRPLTTKTTTNNQLHLQPVSSEDAGSYSCAVNGYQHLPSPDHTLTVRYPPKNVSVFISPSGEVVEDSSVTLTCSSDGHPPVENYTWFKGSVSIGKEKSFRIPTISSEDSGEYTCQSQNQLGQRRSPAVDLNVQYPPRNVSVSKSSSGKIVEDSSTTLTCSSDANPPVEIYTWFIEGRVSPVGSGLSYSPLQSGSYYCEARNEHGAQRSAPFIFRGSSVFMFVAVAVGVGLCGISVLLTVIAWMRRRRKCQDRNMDEDVYANVEHDICPSEDDASSLPDYENVEDHNIHPDDDDDDTCSIPDYVNVEDHNIHPDDDDDDTCSIPDYVNVADINTN